MAPRLALEDRHVCIIGADGPVGHGLVYEFLRQGSKVIADGQPPSIPAGQTSHFICKQSESDSEAAIATNIDETIQGLDPIHVVVCNAFSERLGEGRTLRTLTTFLDAFHAAAARARRPEKELEIVLVGDRLDGSGVQEHLPWLEFACKVNATKVRVNAVVPRGGTGIPNRRTVASAAAVLASNDIAGGLMNRCAFVEGEKVEISESMPDGYVRGEEFLPGVDEQLTSSMSSMITPRKARVQVLLSVDFDAVSGFLGTGASPTNGLADFSSGYFAAQVGVPRLLRLFKKHGIASRVTWFIPGHSMESFPAQTKAIVESGAEIGCHGYAHEGATQLTEAQERDVIEKCVQLATDLTGKKPLGWRAPLYQLREHTVKVLEEHGFLYDSSLTHHDSSPYFLQTTTTPPPINFSPTTPASAWMHPLPPPPPRTPSTLVELPCNWYMEDMTPMQFLPAAANSHGFVSPATIEQNWKARFEFLYHETVDGEKQEFVFPLVLHPDTSGMAHVIGMVERVILWLQGWEDVEFVTFGECARGWRSRQESV
ncbi:hypothetical protein BJX61DRAFT_546600 [Aspergillus egyptiacus]|nr:hypothetical protein BJX61DRAFT_546600 [Aspergillus egyptiacus]